MTDPSLSDFTYSDAFLGSRTKENPKREKVTSPLSVTLTLDSPDPSTYLKWDGKGLGHCKLFERKTPISLPLRMDDVNHIPNLLHLNHFWDRDTAVNYLSSDLYTHAHEFVSLSSHFFVGSKTRRPRTNFSGSHDQVLRLRVLGRESKTKSP